MAANAAKIAAITPQSPMQMRVSDTVGTGYGQWEQSAKASARAFLEAEQAQAQLEARTRSFLSAMDPAYAAQARFNSEMAEAKTLISAGAITLREFPSAAGVLVETRLALRITRDQWQSVQLVVRGAVDLRRVSSTDRRNGLIGTVGLPRGECALGVPFGEGKTRSRQLQASLGDERVVLPLPEGVRDGRWLPVKVGVLPDGRCAVAVDDSVIFISRERMRTGGNVQVQVFGSARDTETAVAGVRIWQGMPADTPWSLPAKPR